MPAEVVASLAKQAGVSVKQAEAMWNKAKGLAQEQGLSPDKNEEKYFAYVVSVLKSMLKIETLDLLHLGWDAEVLTEAIISKSSASFLKSRTRKIASEIAKMSGPDEPNWKSVALNLRLFMNEYVSALSANTGLKKLLMGESVPHTLARICRADTDRELKDVYSTAFPDLDEHVLEEVVCGHL